MQRVSEEEVEGDVEDEEFIDEVQFFTWHNWLVFIYIANNI